MNRIAIFHKKQKTCIIKRSSEENPVQEGLAVTPEKMYEMNGQGIAISTQNLPESMFLQGTTENSFYIEPDYRRGVDTAQLWEEAQTSKKKMRKARNKDIATYGQHNPDKKGGE